MPSGSSRTIRFVEAASRLPRGAVLALALLSIATVGVIDASTGTDVSLSAFYLPPVVLVSTTERRAFRWLAVLLAASVWILADVSARPGYSTAAVPIWNFAVRVGVFGLVGVLASELRRSAGFERTASRTDPLTGLANARSFYEVAEAERARLGRSGSPCTVAYIDVDNFKTVNDTLGHAAGDELLTALAELLQARSRSTDVVARLGGDEFALLLPDTDERGAKILLGDLQNAVAVLAAAQRWPIGVSIGAATFTTAPVDVDEMVHRSDEVMYRVKREGKGTVACVTVGAEAPEPLPSVQGVS